jgi:multiple sugar transport system permease protein
MGTHPGNLRSRGPAISEELSRGELVSGYAFLAPLTAFVAVFVIVPVIGTFAGSLMQDVTFLPKRFVGTGNYRALLSDPGFWQALRFTCLFTLVSVPLELALGLSFALMLARPSPARGLLRACVLIPWAIPAAVSGRTNR